MTVRCTHVRPRADAAASSAGQHSGWRLDHVKLAVTEDCRGQAEPLAAIGAAVDHDPWPIAVGLQLAQRSLHRVETVRRPTVHDISRALDQGFEPAFSSMKAQCIATGRRGYSVAMKLFGSPSSRRGLLASVAAQAPPRAKAYTGARVIDGTDRAPIDNATMVVRDGRIVAVGAAASVTMPAGAQRVSLAGKTVIPGLVNAHGHVGNTVGLEQGHYSAENVARDLSTYAAYGVTTVFSLGDDQAAGIAARDAQSTPSLDRARLFVAGPVLAPKSPADAASWSTTTRR